MKRQQASLNASGTGSASYSSIKIYPSVSGLKVSGNLAAPIVNLNGADNVTFDGRVNATGSTPDLTIENTNTSNTAGTSAITFLSGATYDTVKILQRERFGNINSKWRGNVLGDSSLKFKPYT